jgi:hypothetical protein
MSPRVKFLIGLAAALLVGWIYHGPAGHGELLIDRLEAEARAVVERTEVPGAQVQMARSPLGRTAILSGPVDQFQREGRGEFPGISRRVEQISGVRSIQWVDEPARRYIPLLAEALVMSLLGYLAGLGIARILFGRRRKLSYLD